MPTHPWPFERAFLDDALLEHAFAPADAVADRLVAIEEAAPNTGEALRRMVRALGEAGALGATVPAAHGGAFEAVSSRALCLARERLGHASPLADLAFAMQALGSYPITLRGNDEQKERWLPGVAQGEKVAAFALTEPGAGTDVGAIVTRARRDGDEYVIEGHKIFISNAGVADFYTLFAVTDPEEEPKRRLSAFVVPADAEGLRTTATAVLGDHPIGELYLSAVRVPLMARLGGEGTGLGAALGTLHKLRPTVGAAALGFGERALYEAVLHVKSREQFGAPLAELPLVQARLSDMACALEGARLLVYRAAAAADTTTNRSVITRTGSMAKLIATEAAQTVIDHAVQLHGGRGVLKGSPVARLYEDVRALRIYEGTNDVHKTLIAREVLRS